jgi:hypothetical protein
LRFPLVSKTYKRGVNKEEKGWHQALKSSLRWSGLWQHLFNSTRERNLRDRITVLDVKHL